MKKNILKRPYIFFSILFLIVGESLIYSLLERSIFSLSFYSSYFGYLIFCDVLLCLGCMLFVFLSKTLVRGEFYKLILPALLNLGFLFFVYFSPSFLMDQIILILVLVSNIFIFSDIEKKAKNQFSRFVSFFTSLLLLFSVYSFFYNSPFPYWILVLAADLSLLLLAYHDIASFGTERRFLFLSLTIFAILISEFFLFSFFLPTNSILLKGLFMTFIYYLYWSGLDIYLNKKIMFWEIFKDIATFILLIILTGLYSYLRGDLK